MTRPPRVRIDGKPLEGVAAPTPPSPPTPPPRRAPRERSPASRGRGPAPVLALLRRAPAPQIWAGGACVVVLLLVLALGGRRDETGRSPLDRVPGDAGGPVVATLQLSGDDLRPVRQVCDDEGLPAELCVRSAACAPPAPPAAGRSPRVIRLFLRAPEGGGCA